MKRIALLKFFRNTVAADENCRPVNFALSILTLTVALLFNLPAANAQDPGFSQFFASPLTLNPALTGKFNGVVRVAGNYRNQWPTINNAFITSTISVDAPILTGKLPENDTWVSASWP